MLHFLLSLLHEFLATSWVHPSHLKVILFVLFHAAFERSQVIVYHEAIDWELLLSLQLKDSGHGKVQCHATHQSFDHVKQDFDQSDLVDQNALLLSPVDIGGVLAACQSLELCWVSQIVHVLDKRGRELFQEVLVHFLELLQGDVLERKGSGLHDAADVVFFHIEGQDLDELQNFHVEVMVVHFEMPRADAHSSTLLICVKREEFLQNEETVFEIRVGDLEPQFEVHVVVLVVDDAEAVALEHFTVGHAAVAEVHLRALGERVLTSLHLKFIIVWHVVDDLVPDSFRHIFTHLDLLFPSVSTADFAHFCESSRWFGAHSLVSESLLLDEEIQIIVTLETRGAVASLADVRFYFLLLLFLGLLHSLGLNIFHCHLHQFQADLLILLGLLSLHLVAFLLHLTMDLRLELQQVRFHIVEEIALSLTALLLLLNHNGILFLFFFLDADGLTVFVHTVEACVHILMVHEICKWHHQRNSWPVRTESAVRRHNVDVFEFVHRDVRLSEEMRVIAQDGVQLLPLSEELILTFLGVLDERGVLQVLEVLVLPVHQDVGVLWPRLEHLVMNGLFAKRLLIKYVGVQHIVLTETNVLAKRLRMVVEHLLERLAKHGPLRRYNYPAGHFDEHFIPANIFCGHAAREPVIAGAEEDGVLDLGPLYAFSIAPCEENIESLFRFLDFGVIKPIGVVLVRFARFGDTFDRVEQLQKAEMRLYLHL